MFHRAFLLHPCCLVNAHVFHTPHPQQTYHGRSSHEQRAAMTELSKLLPVVYATVQLAFLLIIPVSQVVTAHRTPEGAKTVLVTFAQNKVDEQRKMKRWGLSAGDFSNWKAITFKVDMTETQKPGILFQRFRISKVCGWSERSLWSTNYTALTW